MCNVVHSTCTPMYAIVKTRVLLLADVTTGTDQYSAHAVVRATVKGRGLLQ